MGKTKTKSCGFPKQSNSKHERKPIDVIKQLGKKYTNLSEEKQKKVKAEIKHISARILYGELNLFATATKKAGTRTVMIVLKELKKAKKEISK